MEGHRPDILGVGAKKCGQSITDFVRCLIGKRDGQNVVRLHAAHPQQLLHAPEHLRPTYVSEDLRGLLTAMPQPTRLLDGSWRCADAQANVERGRLTVSDPTSINALRAALCVTWERADAGEDTDTTAVGFTIA